MGRNNYNDSFYNTRTGALKSAQVIVPIIIDFLKPTSVIDVGCGTADFLKIFLEKGIDDILGIDGTWVRKENLNIPEQFFLQADLNIPLTINRNFDLAISLEVAEHLPKESASSFIDSLTKLSPVILFSAAIPYQGGTQHVNEQWPEYWKSLFETKGFVPVDFIRRIIWNREEVSSWYAQNMLLYIKKDYLEKNMVLKNIYNETRGNPLSIVHPRLYLEKARTHQFVTNLIPRLFKKIIIKVFKFFKNE